MLHLENNVLLNSVPVIIDYPLNKDLANRMMTFMKRRKAWGLAANQLGIEYRLFVMQVEGCQPRRCFNPKVLWQADVFNEKFAEGCLSYPQKLKIKPRSLWILASYLDQNARVVEVELNGHEAICFQHELDHLNGIDWDK